VAPYVDTRVLKMQMAAMYEPVFLSRGGGEFAAWSVPAVDGLGSPQVSWVIDVAGRRLIHCGDTLWHGFWWDIARAYGPFDIALLPINGFRQNQRRYTDTGFPMGMTAEQAAAAAQLLQARVAIPIHYGQHTDPDYTEEPGALELFQAHAQQRGVKVLALAPGEEHNWTQLSRSTMP
jgi:L-ascorbate metabolism protein UlaG (beta-lactamase superfamily)